MENEVIFSAKYKKETHPPLFFNGISVARENATKHLGLILDDRLTFGTCTCRNYKRRKRVLP